MVIHMTRQQLYTRGGILDELMDTGFSAAGLVDAAGRLIRYSVPTLRDLGKTQEECVGRPIEELDPDEGIAEKPQVVVPREKQDEADESASRVVSGFLFDYVDFGTASLVVIWVPLGPCRTVGNAFRFALRRRKRAKARKTHF